MDAILSGKYDTDHLAAIITQTGGGCRFQLYWFHPPCTEKVWLFSHSGHFTEFKWTGKAIRDIKITPLLALRGLYAVVFGDIFMKCVYRMRPYEKVPGTTDMLHEKWKKICKNFVSNGYPHRHTFKKLCREMIQEFDQIETLDVKKPRVGIVGEILVKFLPAANNHLVELLEEEGAEAVVPDLLDFLLYCFYNQNFKVSHLGMKKSKAILGNPAFAHWNGSVRQQAGLLKKADILKGLQKLRNWLKWHQKLFPSETRPVKDGF